MASWDRLSAKKLASARTAAVRRQVVDAVGPFSPYWRDRFQALGRKPAQVASVAGLAGLPAVGERDVCQDGDPAGAAGLVLQAKESGYALHADGPALRRALVRRVGAPRSYRAVVEADTRPTSYVYAGLGVRFPVASTRSDLDVVARAGARLWQVLGLGKADVVVSALPHASTALGQGLQLAALAAGTPLFAAGARVADVAQTLSVVRATVLVLPVEGGAAIMQELAAAEAPVAGITTVLVAGAPDEQERAAVTAAVQDAGAGDAVVLAVHVPDGHRLLWGECRPSGGTTGLHTYPDLELVQLADAETGESVPPGRSAGASEVVLTQLGLRGSALLRWRTGDLADEVTEQPCPACRRTVPRVLGVRGAALVRQVELRSGARPVDLRAVASALSGRPDVADWRVVLGRSARDDAEELLVHVAPAAAADPSDVAVGVARDLRVAAGLLPTQVIVDDSGWLPDGPGPMPRVLT